MLDKKRKIEIKVHLVCTTLHEFKQKREHWKVKKSVRKNRSWQTFTNNYTAMLIPKSSIALYNTFYSMSGKNGALRDKAKYTGILNKAQRQLFSMPVEMQIKNG